MQHELMESPLDTWLGTTGITHGVRKVTDSGVVFLTESFS